MFAQAQAQMVNLMEDIAQARQIFTAQRDGCAAQLDALAEEQAEYAQEQMPLIDHESADFAALQVQLFNLPLSISLSLYFSNLRKMPCIA